MAGRQLFCRIITPEKMVFDGEATMVKLRIADGDIGIMADHQPIVSTVGVREVQVIEENDERRIFATSDGFFKVSENLVQVLVEEAEEASEIDVDAAENRVEEAQNGVAELSSSSEDEEGLRRRRESLEREQAIGETFARVGTEHQNG